MTTITRSVIQHPKNLVLAIMTDDALPQMRLLQRAEYWIGDCLFQFAIIGESHHIRIEQDGKCILNEVLACVAVDEADCQHYQSFTDLHPREHQTPQYRVQVDFGEHPRWFVPLDNIMQLEYTFPQTYEQQPITRIQWRQVENALHWWTLHTYALAEQTIYVHTASVFEFHY
jgi:hypothetical protein